MLKCIDTIKRYYDRVALTGEPIPRHLEHATDMLDEALISYNNGKILDHKSIGKELWSIIQFEEYHGNIQKGQRVLECGTGSGAAALMWAYSGYPVTSIEIDGSLAENTERHLKTIADKLRPEISGAEYQNYKDACSNIRLIKGCSYYPKGYESVYQDNMSVHMLENEIRLTVTGKDHRMSKISFGKDPYEIINIKDFDIIYAFIHPHHVPPLLDMLKRYARDDAVFAIYGLGNCMPHYADRMGLKMCHNGFFTERSTMMRKDR